MNNKNLNINSMSIKINITENTPLIEQIIDGYAFFMQNDLRIKTVECNSHMNDIIITGKNNFADERFEHLVNTEKYIYNKDVKAIYITIGKTEEELKQIKYRFREETNKIFGADIIINNELNDNEIVLIGSKK